jgi:UDP-3-O-[3-hydroxymyristoyl] N-acetylglucosamine deacetylase/3-hydroxyacyl-[acyl-carrier-protein] dehydratase
MSESQTTIGAEVSLSGTGLHGGMKSTLVFKPAEPNTGIRFVRMDLEGCPEIKVHPSSAVQAGDNSRRTVLRSGDVEIGTVEHVLAAVRGLGLDNVRIEIDSPEPPEPDGSGAPFVEVLRKAGRVEQDRARRYIRISRPLTVSEGGVELVALPHDGLRITYTLDYHHPLIGTQHASFDLTGEVFEKEIAPARTFSLLREVEILRERGLIKGGSLENSVVVGDDRLMNDGPLRFPNEFVRHKILDLMGDLSLLGRPVKGHIISVKSGHSTNIRMVKMIDEKFGGGGNKLAGRHVRDVPSNLNIEQIMEIMPHRYPMLLVDRILELEEGKRVVGIKNVTINEPFFAGHFPGHPIMPAVLIVEAMAQTGGVLLLSMVEHPKEKLVYFMAIDKAKFRKPVMPGDQVRFELELVKLKMSTCKMKGKAYVGEDLVAEAELMSVLKDRQEVDRRALGT